MTKDPVCGNQVTDSNAPTSTYQGTQYRFCGQACKQKFDGNPQQYAKSQQAGVSGQSGQSAQSGQQQQKRSGGGAGGGA